MNTLGVGGGDLPYVSISYKFYCAYFTCCSLQSIYFILLIQMKDWQFRVRICFESTWPQYLKTKKKKKRVIRLVWFFFKMEKWREDVGKLTVVFRVFIAYKNGNYCFHSNSFEVGYIHFQSRINSFGGAAFSA